MQDMLSMKLLMQNDPVLHSNVNYVIVYLAVNLYCCVFLKYNSKI